MKHNIPMPVRVIVGSIVLSIVGFYIYTLFQVTTDGPITASGTVEAAEVMISPELAGKVSSVSVAEGETVQAGEVLFSLDGTLLEAQRNAASAGVDAAKASETNAELALEQAQARYEAAYDKAQLDARVLRTSEVLQENSDVFDQPAWYYTIDETLAGLLIEEQNALADLETAKADLVSIADRAGSSNFITVEQELNNARIAYEIAKDVYDKLNASNSDSELIDEAKIVIEDAEMDLNSAQRDYDDALTTEGAQDVLDGRVILHLAQQRVDTVQTKILRFQTGDASLELKMAEIALRQAEGQLTAASAGVSTAEANLAVIDAQISKLVVVSPLTAVAQTKTIEVGEVVNPGMVVFRLMELDNLTVTVYVTEDHYGEITLNQKVEIRVDSFPEQVFEGQVTRISDQAEFTPRNVQTVDGRKTTVFAIKIHVFDPQGLIKPGMPADVTFIQ